VFIITLRILFGVFYALVFKHISHDDYLKSDLNISYLNYRSFLDTYKSLNIPKQDLIVCDYLLGQGNKYDILVSKEEIDLYKDLLLYLRPIIYIEDRYTCCYDDETLVINTYTLSKKSCTYTREDIYKILNILLEKCSHLSTPVFKDLQNRKYKKLYTYYNKGIHE
jgi:hypothetical protein